MDKASESVVCYIKDIGSAIPICSIYVRVEVVCQKGYRCKLKEDAEGDESNASRERRDGPFGRNVAAFPRCVSDLAEASWTIVNRGIVYHSFLGVRVVSLVGVHVFVGAELRIGDLRDKKVHPRLKGVYEMDQLWVDQELNPQLEEVHLVTLREFAWEFRFEVTVSWRHQMPQMKRAAV